MQLLPEDGDLRGLIELPRMLKKYVGFIHCKNGLFLVVMLNHAAWRFPVEHHPGPRCFSSLAVKCQKENSIYVQNQEFIFNLEIVGRVGKMRSKVFSVDGDIRNKQAVHNEFLYPTQTKYLIGTTSEMRS